MKTKKHLRLTKNQESFALVIFLSFFQIFSLSLVRCDILSR